MVYISIYIVMNIGAFACILFNEKRTKYIEEINELSGISKNHPLMCFRITNNIIFSSRNSAISRFFAKFYIFMSVIESGMYTLAIIGLITTVVSAFYYIRIIKIMYFDAPKKPFENLLIMEFMDH